jgi:hypothetical protein
LGLVNRWDLGRVSRAQVWILRLCVGIYNVPICPELTAIDIICRSLRLNPTRDHLLFICELFLAKSIR